MESEAERDIGNNNKMGKKRGEKKSKQIIIKSSCIALK
jgi:hypothetical protein